MKRFVTIISLSIFIFGSISGVNAQTMQGQFVLNGGAGFSISSLVIKYFKKGFDLVDGLEAKSQPNMIFSADYGLKEHFSIGVGYSSQSFDFSYTGYQLDTIVNIGDFEEHFARQNIGVRLLFHVNSLERMDIYGGFRPGFNFWSHTSNNPDQQRVDVDKFFINRPTLQLLIGYRYYFIQNIGFNVELALGSPYFVMGGLSFAFPGRN